MKKFIATIKIRGHAVPTAVFADSAIHARLIFEYQYGDGCILKGPINLEEANVIKPMRPLSPEQYKLASMKQQKDKLSQSIKAERDKLKLAKAQRQIWSVKNQKNST
jgi:hypothetical protein